MTISEIYSHFDIPPNLQRHMFEVTAVADVICENWQGPQIDRGLIIQGCLTHDLGNIVKFKRPFWGELQDKLEYWENAQDEIIQKYGSDTFTVTQKMMEEISVDKKIRELLVFVKAVVDLPDKEHSWEARIVEYADDWVSPEGIIGIKKRLDDLAIRYPNEPQSSWDAMKKNAEVVQPFIKIDLSSLSPQEWALRIEKMKQVDIKIT